MTPQELAADLRARINPMYATWIGTESYERRICAETIEALLAERDVLVTALKKILTVESEPYAVLAEFYARAAITEANKNEGG